MDTPFMWLLLIIVKSIVTLPWSLIVAQFVGKYLVNFTIKLLKQATYVIDVILQCPLPCHLPQALSALLRQML